MKKITDKDVEALKAGKKVTKGFIHMQLDDKGKLNLWSDINITDNYMSLMNALRYTGSSVDAPPP